MKKIISTFLICVLFVTSVFAAKIIEEYDYEMPEFNMENAHIIDLYSLRGQINGNGYFKFYNYINKKLEFRAFVNDPSDKQWKELSTVMLNGFNSSGQATTKEIKKITKCRYFAFIPQFDDTAIQYQISKEYNDLRVYVFNECGNSFFVDGHGAEDYINISNSSSVDLSIKIYGLDKKNRNWIVIANIKDFCSGDFRELKTKYDGDLDNFKWFAIEELNGKEIYCESDEDDDDLYITIYD